jgi:hypothetical protein
MAADPLDRRDRVRAAKQERIAPLEPFYPEAVWGGRNPFSGVLLPKVDQAIVTAAAGCVHCLQP